MNKKLQAKYVALMKAQVENWDNEIAHVRK